MPSMPRTKVAAVPQGGEDTLGVGVLHVVVLLERVAHEPLPRLRDWCPHAVIVIVVVAVERVLGVGLRLVAVSTLSVRFPPPRRPPSVLGRCAARPDGAGRVHAPGRKSAWGVRGERRTLGCLQTAPAPRRRRCRLPLHRRHHHRRRLRRFRCPGTS